MPMGDAFALPCGNVQVAFSGGRTSAFMLYKILETNGGLPDRAVVSFQNTGREMPQTLDFVQECGERWGVKITWLEYRPNAPFFDVVSHNSASRDGAPFEALIRKRKYLPNQQARFCTSELKVNAARRYCRSLGWKDWAVAVGIRADEQSRIRAAPAKSQFTNWYPLVAAGISKRDVSNFWAAQPFDLRLPNVNGRSPLGNCDGCFLKSEANWAALAREYPERAAWWERMESVASSLTKSPGGATFSKRGGRASLRQFMRDQGDLLSKDGVLCQATDGECFG